MRNNRSSWLSAAPLALVMSLGLACSQERATVDSETPAPATAATATDSNPPTDTTLTLQAQDAVEVSLVDYEIRMPATLPAGPIEFKVTNNGQVDHNFEVEGNGIEQKLEQPLKPLEVATLRMELTPGTYEVYCPHENHDESHNMRRQLTVTPSAASPATDTATSTTTG